MSQLALLGGSKVVTRPFPTWPIWDDDDRRALSSTLESGRWWMYAYGDAELGADEDATNARSQVEQFEVEFAQLHRVEHAIAVTSGDMALEICTRAIDLQPGDEVITTPYTFFATSSCILNCHALPVYVDIDPDTYNIDPTGVERAITERTRAILPVDFAGEVYDYEPVNAIAQRHGLIVLEDSAQAHGVCLEGARYGGTFGRMGIFSFQESKCLTGGEGGLIITDDDDLAELAWSLRHYGRSRTGLWYEHFRLGWNARMTEFTAALLRAQLRKLPQQNAIRMKNVRHLYDGLEEIDGLEPIDLHPRGVAHNHYLVLLRYKGHAWDGLPRERFIEALNAEGVPAVSGYSFGNYGNPVLKTLDLSSTNSPFMTGRSAPIDYSSFPERCPVTERACNQEAIWFTHPLFLGDTAHVDMILDAIRKVRANIGDLLAPSWSSTDATN